MCKPGLAYQESDPLSRKIEWNTGWRRRAPASVTCRNHAAARPPPQAYCGGTPVAKDAFRVITGSEFLDWCKKHGKNPITWQRRPLPVPGAEGWSIKGDGVPIGDDLEVAIVWQSPQAVIGYAILSLTVPASVIRAADWAIGQALALYALDDVDGALAADAQADEVLQHLLPMILKASGIPPAPGDAAAVHSEPVAAQAAAPITIPSVVKRGRGRPRGKQVVCPKLNRAEVIRLYQEHQPDYFKKHGRQLSKAAFGEHLHISAYSVQGLLDQHGLGWPPA